MNTKNKTSNIKAYATLIFTIMLSATLLLAGCVEEIPDDTSPSNYYSFEENMQDWESDGTDLSSPPINWSIERSDDRATDGNKSLKLYLDNMNDAGKIWIEKQFELDANTQYEITIDYDFATSDFGSFNLFKIITGASLTNPETYDDLTFQDHTGHNQQEDIGYTWLNKSYTLTVETNDNGTLYLSIGVWGTWETPRTYYIDAVNISFDKVALEGIPDVSGPWIISYYDFMGNVTKTENVTLIQNETAITAQTSNETLFTGTLLKNNLPAPDNKTDFIITDCDFRGLGIDYIFVYNETMMETNLPLCENCRPAVFTR
ncbi:MAG TPA: hypothetical protein VKP59_02255 [Candidatus Thermoplasmatota archaeon]|nr:hypothetical protein [Candidatus Thermoplasmatota archaeon]